MGDSWVENKLGEGTRSGFGMGWKDGLGGWRNRALSTLPMEAMATRRGCMRYWHRGYGKRTMRGWLAGTIGVLTKLKYEVLLPVYPIIRTMA